MIKSQFKPIIEYLKPFKKAIWITFIFVVIENVISLANPLIFGRIIDEITSTKMLSTSALTFAIIWFVFNLSDNWFMRKKNIRANQIGNRASFNLLTNAVRHVISLPLSFHKKSKIGEIIQRITRADDFLYNFIYGGLFRTLPGIITSFVACIVIFFIEWHLALIYLLFLVSFIIITRWKTKPLIVLQKGLNKLFEDIYGNIFDRTSKAGTIKANTAENQEYGRNLDRVNKTTGKIDEQMFLWMNMEFWQNASYSIAFLIFLVAGIHYVQTSAISVGKLVSIIFYFNISYWAMYNLGGIYKNLQEGLVTIGRVEKLTAEISEPYDDPKAMELNNIKGDIIFDKVTFSYEKNRVLEDVSFVASSGKIVAIVGKSGEGKTTLVDLISRYIVPQSGKIMIDGIELEKIKLNDLRKNIAIVPQEVDLFNDTIRNNIAYSNPEAKKEEIEKAAKMAYCHEFIEKFPKKYEQVVGERGIKLSTGQKQRVAIARAILRNPRILILDEATSALDSESERYVQLALKEVFQGRTTFVIAHRLSTIQRADLILVLEDGKIVESGDHEELVKKGGVYQKLSELQNIRV